MKVLSPFSENTKNKLYQQEIIIWQTRKEVNLYLTWKTTLCQNIVVVIINPYGPQLGIGPHVKTDCPQFFCAFLSQQKAG